MTPGNQAGSSARVGICWRNEEGRRPSEDEDVTLRCLLDGLLLPAYFPGGGPRLVAYDGDESFVLEALEATYYEVVVATAEEWLGVEQGRYRLLRPAADFRWAGLSRCP
jgi:hypothetical protein